MSFKDTLPKFISEWKPLKMDGWFMLDSASFGVEFAYFQGRLLAVSFREDMF